MKALLFLLLLPASLIGQSIDAVIGGSQLLGTAGVQTQFRYNGRFGWTGIGYYNGFKAGGYMNMPLRMFTFEDTSRDKYRIGIGDQEMDSSITTDESDQNQAMIRGSSLLRHTKNSDLQVFVGNFSSLDMEPFLYSLYQLNPSIIGAVVGKTRLSKTVSLKSYNVFGGTSTSIQSVSWKPRRNWNVDTAAGLGNSKPYFANAVEYHHQTLDLRAAYVLADSNFHRQDGTYGIESLGFNAKAEIPLGRVTTVRFNRRHQLMTVPKYLGFQYASSLETAESAGISTSFFGFHANANATKSTSNRTVGNNYTGLTSVSRKIIPRWNSTFSYLHLVMSSSNIVVYQNTNQFRISNHLALSQNLAVVNGAVNNTFGGQWSSNRISFSVDNQVYVSPIAAQFGQKSVFQAWNFSIRFRTPHGTQVHLETTVDPLGKTQWGGYMSGLQYHGLGTFAPETQHVNFSKYIIIGKVEDEHGKGVWGIALEIGGEIVMSDTDGSFFVHVRNSKPIPFEVNADASLQSRRWVLTTAPPSVQGRPEDKPGDPVRVVVQMSGNFVVKNSDKPVVIEPRRETASVSSSVEPRELQVAMLNEPQLPGDHGITQPQHKAEPVPASDQAPDPQFPTHFVVEKGPGIVDYEIPQRTSERSASDQVRDLQAAVDVLRAPPAPHLEKHLKEHRTKRPGKVLQVLGRILCFRWLGRTHKTPVDETDDAMLSHL